MRMANGGCAAQTVVATNSAAVACPIVPSCCKPQARNGHGQRRMRHSLHTGASMLVLYKGHAGWGGRQAGRSVRSRSHAYINRTHTWKGCVAATASRLFQCRPSTTRTFQRSGIAGARLPAFMQVAASCCQQTRMHLTAGNQPQCVSSYPPHPSALRPGPPLPPPLPPPQCRRLHRLAQPLPLPCAKLRHPDHRPARSLARGTAGHGVRPGTLC